MPRVPHLDAAATTCSGNTPQDSCTRHARFKLNPWLAAGATPTLLEALAGSSATQLQLKLSHRAAPTAPNPPKTFVHTCCTLTDYKLPAAEVKVRPHLQLLLAVAVHQTACVLLYA